MSLASRLALLERGGVVSPQARSLALAATDTIERSWGVRLSEDTWGMGITHIATVLTRLANGEALPAVDRGVLGEVDDHPEELALARTLVAFFEATIGAKVDETETYLVALHLAAARGRIMA